MSASLYVSRAVVSATAGETARRCDAASSYCTLACYGAESICAKKAAIAPATGVMRVGSS